MVWRTIRNCGKVNSYFNNIDIQTDQGEKTVEFLNETLSKFAEVSTWIFDTTGDFAFAYKEKQLSSVLLPAFFSLGYGAIQEVPTRRKERGQESSHGWLDYWVQKDDELVYLIEVKHGLQLLNASITKDSLDKLNDSVSQLKKIRKDEVKKLSIVETTKTTKISLLVLPVWSTIHNEDIAEEDDPKIDKSELEATARNIVEEVSDISWLGIWSMPDKNGMKYAFQPKNKIKLESFVGVIFIVKVVK